MVKDKSTKVLLLDDDQDIRELLTDYFKPRGYEFISYSSAEQGLDEIVRQSSCSLPIDLVITDFRLPNMSGIELIKRLKKIAPQIPIILITAHSSLDLAIEAIQMGAFDFVVKPIQFPQLSISMARAVHFGRLQIENEKLKSKMDESVPEKGQIIAKSPLMKSTVDLATRVAKSDATVLISGESGTGKEVIAKHIHSSSKRAEKPFVAINCSAIPETLLESELFGHAKGSFTGASETKIGLFEEASGGTLFLDEIGDLSLPLQAKLLRVIQEWKIKRVGENQYREIDVRLLVATHKDLSEEVRSMRFREDLFFRLNVIPIKVVPLRDRKEDILPLAEHFLRSFVRRGDSKVSGFSKKSLEFLLRNPWRGNVRELENTIERAVVLCDSNLIEEKDLVFPTHNDGAGVLLSEATEGEYIEQMLKEHGAQAPMEETEATDTATVDSSIPIQTSVHLLAVGELVPLAVVELRYIQHVLAKVGNVKDRAAKVLQVDRKTLYRKLELIAEVPTLVSRA